VLAAAAKRHYTFPALSRSAVPALGKLQASTT
jgi:hypothetical protein